MKHERNHGDIPEGYEWDPQSQNWRKTLIEEEISVPGLGRGNYKMYHETNPQRAGEHIGDYFAAKYTTIFVREREINPFTNEFQDVKTRWVSSTPHWFEYCDVSTLFSYTPPRLYEQVDAGVRGFYRVVYNHDGNLQDLNISEKGPFVGFNFAEKKITDSDSNLISTIDPNSVDQAIIRYNDFDYHLSQLPDETTVEIIRPVDTSFQASVTVPRTINYTRIKEILYSDDKEWLRLPEHLLIRAHWAALETE